MTSWKTYRLRDICDLVAGFAFKSKDFGDYPNKVVKIADIQPPIVNTNDLVGVDMSNYDANKLRKYIVTKGDYVLAMTGATIGKLGRITNDIEACINQRVLTFRPIESIVDKDYLYYQLCSDKFNKYILNHIDSETAQPNISAGSVGGFEISLPPLEKQRRIAGILGAIDDKIENNRHINDNLEQQAQALYKQWFVDFEFPNEEGKPYKSSGGKMVDSELGQIPEGWSVGDIYKYVNVVYGAPYKSALFNERKDGNPLIRIRDLKTFSPQYYTQEILPNTEYVNAGDVVAGMDAEFVPCLWMGEKGVLNQRCCKFVGKQDSISNYYVMFLVKPELEFVQSYKTGTTVSHLGKADIDKFIVVQPPMTVIEKFSKIADALLNNKIKLAKENITLATLRDTLLPKLMSGEIKM